MWIILPIVNGEDYLRALLPDLVNQTIETRMLILDQASNRECSDYLQGLQDESGRILVWRFDPALSLGAAWNVAMEFVASQDEAGAWILNHDIRVRREMGDYLQHMQSRFDAYFVSGVGVTKKQFDAFNELPAGDAHGRTPEIAEVVWDVPGECLSMGGPDFSCFVYTIKGWRKYPFAEIYYPAYCEDVDLHRRMMLGGDGQKILGINFPFYHVGSTTIRHSKRARKAHDARHDEVLAAYKKKWGGPPNGETFALAYDGIIGDARPDTVHLHRPDVTTPALFAVERKKWGGE
ncbi:hypothetical protein LCGC14_1895260 [marine sediment metagenome]|uniref:Glycosyltransferase 2-like domain-containing protein n=1 Tax=marine sediment metagenome TaxID=412755 RepID=A0A0F9GLL5_9ZZZZ